MEKGLQLCVEWVFRYFNLEAKYSLFKPERLCVWDRYYILLSRVCVYVTHVYIRSCSGCLQELSGLRLTKSLWAEELQLFLLRASHMVKTFLQFSVNFSKININLRLGHFLGFNYWLGFITQNIIFSYTPLPGIH